MRYEKIVLKPNDVIYIISTDHSNELAPIKKSTMRIENINGELFETMLPDFYTQEDDVKFLEPTPKLNLFISSGESCDDIIIKKHARTNEIGFVHYNRKNAGYMNRPKKEYNNVMNQIASKKFNENEDRTDPFFFQDQMYRLIDMYHISEDFIWSVDYTTFQRYFQKILAKERNIRIKDSKHNSETKDNEFNQEQ